MHGPRRVQISSGANARALDKIIRFLVYFRCSVVYASGQFAEQTVYAIK